MVKASNTKSSPAKAHTIVRDLAGDSTFSKDIF